MCQTLYKALGLQPQIRQVQFLSSGSLQFKERMHSVKKQWKYNTLSAMCGELGTVMEDLTHTQERRICTSYHLIHYPQIRLGHLRRKRKERKLPVPTDESPLGRGTWGATAVILSDRGKNERSHQKTRQGMPLSIQPEHYWVNECSVTIRSAPLAALLSVGTQTISSFREHKSSLYCPLRIYLYEVKVKNIKSASSCMRQCPLSL